MLPWVVLGITLAVGLLVSVIYTAVVYFIDGLVVHGVLWLIFGLIWVGKYLHGVGIVFSSHLKMQYSSPVGVWI